MSYLPTLVRDTQLVGEVRGDITTHPRSRVKQVWKRERRIGAGGFGSVYVERRIGKAIHGQPGKRAVKRIRNATHEQYVHELEAIAKFSASRVGLPNLDSMVSNELHD